MVVFPWESFTLLQGIHRVEENAGTDALGNPLEIMSPAGGTVVGAVGSAGGSAGGFAGEGGASVRTGFNAGSPQPLKLAFAETASASSTPRSRRPRSRSPTRSFSRSDTIISPGPDGLSLLPLLPIKPDLRHLLEMPTKLLEVVGEASPGAASSSPASPPPEPPDAVVQEPENAVQKLFTKNAAAGGPPGTAAAPADTAPADAAPADGPPPADDPPPASTSSPNANPNNISTSPKMNPILPALALSQAPDKSTCLDTKASLQAKALAKKILTLLPRLGQATAELCLLLVSHDSELNPPHVGLNGEQTEFLCRFAESVREIGAAEILTDLELLGELLRLAVLRLRKKDDIK